MRVGEREVCKGAYERGFVKVSRMRMSERRCESEE